MSSPFYSYYILCTLKCIYQLFSHIIWNNLKDTLRQTDRLKLISQKKAASSPEYSVGLYYSGTGQIEEALYWLERA